jgi:Fe2+ transport system protein FeoA
LVLAGATTTLRTIRKMTRAPNPTLHTPAWRNLTELGVGEEARVTHVDAPPAEVARLAGLGVAPGARLRLLRRGASLSLAVGDARIALGGDWARAVSVLRSGGA